MSYELRVTSPNPRFTSSNSQVRTLKARAARSKAQVRRETKSTSWEIERTS